MPQRTNQDYCFYRKTYNRLLPPQPVFTYWGKSFQALEYWSRSYEVTAEIIQEFSDTDDAACVGLVRETVPNANVKKNVANIA
jgi:hypothetical protein